MQNRLKQSSLKVLKSQPDRQNLIGSDRKSKMSSLSVTTRRLGRLALLSVESMWVFLILSSYVLQAVESSVASNPHGAVDLESNEFAEFEEFDDQMPTEESEAKTGGGGAPGPPTEEIHIQEEEEEDSDEDGMVEDEVDDEFSHLEDTDEFENYNKDRPDLKTAGTQKGGQQQTPQLRFADVPAHLRNNWTNYQVELLMLFGLSIYLLNYAYGKTKNQSLAYAWFEEHKDFLEEQFALVGDDGTSVESKSPLLIKESDSSYSIWCSGRQGCLGMLVQLKLLKRQDLVSIISQIIRPKYDKVSIRMDVEPNEMDGFVMAVGQKKTLSKIVKEMTDLCHFTTEKKNADKVGLPASFTVYTEIAEATAAMLDPKVLSIVNKYEDYIDYLHFSDQYSGLKPQEGESQSKLPETSKVLVFNLNIPGKLAASERHVQSTRPMMNLVFHCLEKVRRYKLSREGKSKADKNRQLVQESFLKTTHAQRQEAAQTRREEKIRARKQRLMDEEDPDKQRMLEKQELKREAKKKQPKMKQLKIKSM